MPTNYNYTSDIPFATHKPSVDQPNMKENTNSIKSIIGTDHLTFLTASGSEVDGYHKVIHFANQSGDPAAIVGTGQLYTKTELGDQQLFYRSGGGTITQLTNASGFPPKTPIILTGTFASTGSFTNVSALPANVYGYIIFYHLGSPSATQMSSFVTNGSSCFASSSRIVDNGTSNDDPIELNNNSGTLFLKGRSDDFGDHNWPWVIQYWSF
jgi:hypothetical protein